MSFTIFPSLLCQLSNQRSTFENTEAHSDGSDLFILFCNIIFFYYNKQKKNTEVTIKLVKIGKGISSVENHLLNDKHGLTKHRINYTKQLVIAFPRSQSSQFLSQPHTINNLNPKTHEEIKHEKVRWVTVEKTSVQT